MLKELSVDEFNLVTLQLVLFPFVLIVEIVPISYPEILTVVPLLFDAVKLVPVIVPVAESPVAFMDPAVIVPNEIFPGWSLVSPAPPSITAVTVPLPASIVALLVISAVPLPLCESTTPYEVEVLARRVKSPFAVVILELMVISRPASRDKFPPELPVTLIAFDTVISWLALRYTSVPAFNKS